MIQSQRMKLHSEGPLNMLCPKIARKFVLYLIFLCLTMAGTAVYSQTWVPVKDMAGFKSQYAAKSASLNSLNCDFKQEKQISMLDHKILSEGSFIYKKSNMLRMEYRKPSAFLFIMKNDQVTVRNNLRQTTVSTNSNKLFRMISQVTIDCVTGNILNTKDFSIDISESPKQYQLSMVPLQKALRSLFSRISIVISRNDFTVETLELDESSGDITRITFANKQINVPVSDATFEIR